MYLTKRMTELFCSVLIALVLSIALLAGCAGTQLPEDGEAAAAEAGASAQESGRMFSSETKEGPAELEIDYTDYKKKGSALVDIHTVEIRVIDPESGETVFHEQWRDQSWHSGQGNAEEPQEIWNMEDLPQQDFLISLHIGSNSSSRRWLDANLEFGPVKWDLSGNDRRKLVVTPFPFRNAGTLIMKGTNETGIGSLNSNLGVFLQSIEGRSSYHFHLEPGQEYLSYERKEERIRPGTYAFTVLANKNNSWPYYGNAVWEGELSLAAGETVEIAGELKEKIAPWDLGISEEDFQLESEETLYQTQFDEPDPRMDGPHSHQSELEHARFEGGNLVVEGEGELSGGLGIKVPTGKNSIIRFRALLPENGQFFINSRVWGGNRIAIIFDPEREERRPSIGSFSTAQGEDLPAYGSHNSIPELNSEQWYDYTLIDDGERMFILIDNSLTMVLPISEELPERGELNIEWHLPCRFDNLSVSTFDSIRVPASLE